MPRFFFRVFTSYSAFNERGVRGDRVGVAVLGLAEGAGRWGWKIGLFG